MVSLVTRYLAGKPHNDLCSHLKVIFQDMKRQSEHLTWSHHLLRNCIYIFISQLYTQQQKGFRSSQFTEHTLNVLIINFFSTLKIAEPILYLFEAKLSATAVHRMFLIWLICNMFCTFDGPKQLKNVLCLFLFCFNILTIQLYPYAINNSLLQCISNDKPQRLFCFNLLNE